MGFRISHVEERKQLAAMLVATLYIGASDCEEREVAGRRLWTKGKGECVWSRVLAGELRLFDLALRCNNLITGSQCCNPMETSWHSRRIPVFLALGHLTDT
jgi:hypothetical protein